MARGDRSIRASSSAVALACLVALVAVALAGVPVTPGFAAAPASLELEVSSGTHGPLPQAARLTYRIRVRNGGAVAAQGVTLEQELPPGVVPLGSPALGDGSAEGCLVLGSAGPDGASRFRASCDVGTLPPGGGAVMVVRTRVDRATCGELGTTVTAAEDGVRRATAAHEVRVVCTCGVRLSRDVSRVGAVGSNATLRITVRNPGPHPLRYDLSGAGHRLATGVLPSGGIRHLRHTLRLDRATHRRADRRPGPCAGRPRMPRRRDRRDRRRHWSRPTTSMGPRAAARRSRAPPAHLPVAGALVFLMLGLASLAVARRGRG